MERARTSDHEAFTAALVADARAFARGHDGQVSVADGTAGSAPAVTIARATAGSSPSTFTIRLSVGEDPEGRLALSVDEREHLHGTAPATTSRFVPVLRDAAGAFYLLTHVGRIVAAGEFSEYFWTVAAARLDLED